MVWWRNLKSKSVIKISQPDHNGSIRFTMKIYIKPHIELYSTLWFTKHFNIHYLIWASQNPVSKGIPVYTLSKALELTGKITMRTLTLSVLSMWHYRYKKNFKLSYSFVLLIIKNICTLPPPKEWKITLMTRL